MYRKTGGMAVLAKPPKPPCWRDFVSDRGGHNGLSAVEFGEVLPQVPAPAPAAPAERAKTYPQCLTPGKQLKRVRAKIHRTRSHFPINARDIPDEKAAVSLSETKPKELLGLRRHDEKMYLEENARRCQSWLDSIKACEPLDDVVFSQGSGVEIEVPDEQRWTDLRPPLNSSASGSDDDRASESDPPACRQQRRLELLRNYSARGDGKGEILLRQNDAKKLPRTKKMVF